MSLIVAFEQCLARHQLLQSPHTLTVAYSGGVDSQVLLELAYQLAQKHPQLTINAIHVNHGLSALAHQWQSHCEQQCAQRHIPLQVANVDVKPSARESLEAVARNARYQAFQNLIEPDAILLLGHHLDDQAETFLLQLKRGAGAKGLSGMAMCSAAEQNQHGLTIVRPLLQQSRADIQAFASAQQLVWVDDESNSDTRFDRNFLRHDVLPLLQQRWPAFTQSVSRSARLISEQQTLVEQTAGEYLQRCQVNLPTQRWYAISEEFVLNAEQLLSYSTLWQKQIVRLWIQSIAATRQRNQKLWCEPPVLPNEARLNELLLQVTQARDDADMAVKCGEWQFRRFQQQLYLLPGQDSTKTGDSGTHRDNTITPPIFWQGESQLHLPTGDSLGFRQLNNSVNASTSERGVIVSLPLLEQNPVQVVFGGLSRRFKPSGAAHSKPLKQWFKLWQVPPWHRHRIPLLLLNDKLVAVGSKFIAQDIADSAHTDQRVAVELCWDRVLDSDSNSNDLALTKRGSI